MMLTFSPTFFLMSRKYKNTIDNDNREYVSMALRYFYYITKTILLGLVFFFLQPKLALGLDCTALEPRSGANINEEFKGEIDGRLDGLFARFAGVETSVKGLYQRAQEDILPQYGGAAPQLYIWERLIFLQCQMLNELDLSDEEKRRQFQNLLDTMNFGPPTACKSFPQKDQKYVSDALRYYTNRYIESLKYNKNKPDTTYLYKAVELINDCPAYEKERPGSAALAWRLLGVSILLDTENEPNIAYRSASAMKYFSKSLDAVPDQKELVEMVSLLRNAEREGTLDAAKYIIAMDNLFGIQKDDNFEDAFRDWVASEDYQKGQESINWLLEKATIHKLEKILEYKRVQAKFEQNKIYILSTNVEKKDGFFYVSAALDGLKFEWLVDIDNKRYKSLSKSTEHFMISEVKAPASTFSRSFEIDGYNTPLMDMKGHDQTRYAITWWFEEENPDLAGDISLMAWLHRTGQITEEGIKLKDDELPDSDEIPEELKQFEIRARWLKSKEMELQIKIDEKYSYIWLLYPIEKKYKSASVDAMVHMMSQGKDINTMQ